MANSVGEKINKDEIKGNIFSKKYLSCWSESMP